MQVPAPAASNAPGAGTASHLTEGNADRSVPRLVSPRPASAQARYAFHALWLHPPRHDDAAKVVTPRFPKPQLVSRDNPRGQSGGSLDARPAHEHDGAGRRHLVEVVHHLDLQVSLVEHPSFAGEVAGLGGKIARVGVERLVAVHGDVALVVEELQRLHGPSGAVLAALVVEVVERVVVGPALRPVGAQRHERAGGDAAVLRLPCLDVVDRDGHVGTLCRDLGREVDHDERHHHVGGAVCLGAGGTGREVVGEVDMRAELTRELVGMDTAGEHLLVIIEHGAAELHRPRRDACPVRAVVGKRMGELHPGGAFQFVEFGPQAHGSSFLATGRA